jgi:hypothetical protein
MTDLSDKANSEEDGLPPCMISVDKEGAWFHNGVPIVHRGFVLLFYQSIHLDDRGRYILKLHNQTCRLDVEDTPFVVLRVTFLAKVEQRGGDCFMLHLIDETQEPLDPTTLTVGNGHVLYCKIRQGRFTARFCRPAYYQLAQHIQEDPESRRFFISLNGNRYTVDNQCPSPDS